jgi:hypothetical protein
MTPYVAVALTSLAAYLVAVMHLGLRPSDLGRALGRLADSLGSGVVFALLNVVTAAGLILGLRAATDRFFSFYALDDLVWLVVSVLQGWIWRLWRESTTREI